MRLFASILLLVMASCESRPVYARRPTITSAASVTAAGTTIAVNTKTLTKGVKVFHRHVIKPTIKAVTGK